MTKKLLPAGILAAATLCLPAFGQPLIFTTGTPDGRMGVASRQGPSPEIEAADDFILTGPTLIQSATFIGLIPTGATLASITDVGVEIYRVFPFDSVNPPSGNVPTRVNSPSDNAFASRDSSVPDMTFTVTILNPTFTAANSVLNGINKIPNQTTGGEGAITGQEVQFSVVFTKPIFLPADHYFFVPQVQLSSGNFFWLSTARTAPIFPGDLQAWVRNENLDPDWLRVGTDIVGGSPAPTFNEAFSISGIPSDAFQIRYSSNLTSGDSVINITNSGLNGASLAGPGFGGAAGNLCVNAYAFSPDEQLVSCCSCLVTPNGLASLSVVNDLISNTLTGVRPSSVVVKLIATGAGTNFTGTSCTNSAAQAGSDGFPLAGGLLAWGTTIHAAAAAGTFATTETAFNVASLSTAELASIRNRCTNIVGNGSTFGICRSCRAGALGAMIQ